MKRICLKVSSPNQIENDNKINISIVSKIKKVGSLSILQIIHFYHIGIGQRVLIILKYIFLDAIMEEYLIIYIFKTSKVSKTQ